MDSIPVLIFLIGLEVHFDELNPVPIQEVSVNHPDAAHDTPSLQGLTREFPDLINFGLLKTQAWDSLNAVMLLVKLVVEVKGSGNKDIQILWEGFEFFCQLLEVSLKLRQWYFILKYLPHYNSLRNKAASDRGPPRS